MMNSSLTNLTQNYKKYTIIQNIKYFSMYKFCYVIPVRVKVNSSEPSL